MSEIEWFVVRTNPRCEERAMASLQNEGFAVYMPKTRRILIHHRRKKEFEREYPLMRGYLFLGMERHHRHWGYVRACDGVKSVLGIGGRPLPVPAADVEAVFEAEFRGEYDDLMQRRYEALGKRKHNYRKGDRVRISRGYLGTDEGREATVLRARSNNRLRLLTKMVEGMVEVSIPVDDVECAA